MSMRTQPPGQSGRVFISSRRARPTRAVVHAALAAAVFAASGCALWRRDTSPLANSAAAAELAAARTDLATEQKILRQELVLARQENAAMRAALERSGQIAPDARDAQLAALLQEVDALRASHAQLAAGRTTGENPSGPAEASRIRTLEEQLAAAEQSRTQLQREISALQRQLNEQRTENLALAEELRRVRLQHQAAESLAAQRATESNILRPAESAGVTRSGDPASAARRDAAGEPVASEPAHPPGSQPDREPVVAVSRLQLAKSPPAGAATSDIRELQSAVVSADLASTSSHASVLPEDPAAPPGAPRVHVVRAGDTLEQLSRTYYGVPDRWHLIYEANQTELSSGRPMRPGTELTIPPER